MSQVIDLVPRWVTGVKPPIWCFFVKNFQKWSTPAKGHQRSSKVSNLLVFCVWSLSQDIQVPSDKVFGVWFLGLNTPSQGIWMSRVWNGVQFSEWKPFVLSRCSWKVPTASKTYVRRTLCLFGPEARCRPTPKTRRPPLGGTRLEGGWEQTIHAVGWVKWMRAKEQINKPTTKPEGGLLANDLNLSEWKWKLPKLTGDVSVDVSFVQVQIKRKHNRRNDGIFFSEFAETTLGW